MQQEGRPKFFNSHSGLGISAAFSPKDRYLCCSGGTDGLVYLYSALRMEKVHRYRLTCASSPRTVYALRFVPDGTKILACIASRQFTILDVETDQQLRIYDNCAFSSRHDSLGIATDPTCPQLAVIVAVNGKGLTLFDLRMELPIDFIYDLHDDTIRSVLFLHGSWPWTTHTPCLLTAASDGAVKVASVDGQVLHQFSTFHPLNSVLPSPEKFNSAPCDNFYSVIMCGGSVLSSYVPDIGMQETQKVNNEILKLRYTNNGSTLYSGSEDGWVRRYRRYPDHHKYIGKVFSHTGAVSDLDISPYDEYIISTSRSGYVGILQLGSPSHGFTEYCELT